MQQQQPHPPQMIPVMPSFPPTNITTEQIQKYLDENKKLILAILDNQNLGKLAECAQYQAQLQKNLMYLAAIADAQPQAPTMPTQMTPHPAMQQGGFYMQHPQAAAMGQQPGNIFPQKVPLQFNSPNQMQDHQHLHHQQQLLHQHQQAAIQQGQMGMRPPGSGGGGGGPNNNGMHHSAHPEATLGGGAPPKPTGPSEGRAGSKPDGADGQGGSASGQGGEEAK